MHVRRCAESTTKAGTRWPCAASHRRTHQFTQILQVARSGNTGEMYAFDPERAAAPAKAESTTSLRQIGLLVDRLDSRSIPSLELRDPGVNMVAGERPTAGT